MNPDVTVFLPHPVSALKESNAAAGEVTRPTAEPSSLCPGSDAAPPLEAQCDEFLLEQVAEGNREALGILFRRHARLVRNVALRILRDEAEADDLVQEVFIFLFRKANLYQATRGQALSWILQVAYHRAFDHRRYLNVRRYYNSLPVDAAMQIISQERADAVFTQWTLESVWGADSAARLRMLLSPNQLATIQLHFFEGQTLEEIAELLGQNIGNVKHHYFRALEKLRRPAFSSRLRSK